MVTLQTFGETGRACPKCENHSVFSNEDETAESCHMGDCDYEALLLTGVKKKSHNEGRYWGRIQGGLFTVFLWVVYEIIMTVLKIHR